MKSLAIAIALISVVHAQELAPELAPIAAKYRADIAALEEQKADTIFRAHQAYSAALDAAEKNATAAGSVDVVAAIVKERESLKANAMAAVLPSGFPKSLAAPRKAVLDATSRAAAEVAPRQRTVNAEYLRALAALQLKAAGNAVLQTQIAAEKEKALANAGSAADPSGLFGKWNFTDPRGGVLVVAISPSGDIELGKGADRGKWTVENGFMLLHWGNGFKSRMSLSAAKNTLRADELAPGSTEWVAKFKVTKAK